MNNRALNALCAVTLVACGGGGGGGGGAADTAPAVAPAPAPSPSVVDQIALLEDSGQLPKLDRSSGLAGPDGNANGVRDDVDLIIAGNYPDVARKAAATQLARALQSALLANPSSQSALASADTQILRAVRCAHATFPNEASVVVRNMEAVTANTKERFTAYHRVNSALNGTTSTLPEGNTCE